MSENTQVIRNFYAAMGQGDIPSALGAIDARCVWNEADNFLYADGNPYVGVEAIVNGVFARIGGQWDGFAATPEHFVGEGDTVISRGRYTGTYKATGKQVSAQFVHVFTVKDGKIAGFQQYTDTAQFRDAAA